MLLDGFFVFSASAQVEFNVASACQNCRLDIRVTLVYGCDSEVALRLGHHGDFQRAGCDVRRRQFRAQAFEAVILEKSLHFPGWAGQQNDGALCAIVLGLDPLAWGSALRIRQNRCSINYIGLSLVVFRHLHAPLGEAGVEAREDFGIAVQFAAKSGGDSFACQVVLGGAEPAGDDNDLCAADRGAYA